MINSDLLVAINDEISDINIGADVRQPYLRNEYSSFLFDMTPDEQVNKPYTYIKWLYEKRDMVEKQEIILTH